MKDKLVFGLAALVAGGAAGFMIGRVEPGSVESENPEVVMNEAKLRRSGQMDGEEPEKRSRTRYRTTTDALNAGAQSDRLQGMIDLYADMSVAELELELAKLDSLPWGDRILASMLIFSRWGELDPYSALDETNRMGMGGMFAKPTVMRSWASMDPVNAAKYYSENPGQFMRMGGMGGGRGAGGASVIAGEWAKDDPDAALAWAKGLEGRERSSALVSALGSMAVKDPAEAAAVAASLGEDAGDEAYSEIASQWARQDFDSAQAWINTLSGSAKQEALGSAIEVLAGTDPQGAAEMVSQMESGGAMEGAVADVAEALSRDDPAGAADWLSQQGEAASRDAMRRVMGNWVQQEPAEALTFVQAQETGELRDSAASTYIWMNQSAEPTESMELAESISDDRRRNRMVGLTARRWMEQDESAARSYIESSTSLDDGTKERILNGGGGWGRGR